MSSKAFKRHEVIRKLVAPKLEHDSPENYDSLSDLCEGLVSEIEQDNELSAIDVESVNELAMDWWFENGGDNDPEEQ